MRKTLLVVLLAVACVVCGCGGNHDRPLSAAIEKEEGVSYDMSAVYTKGNFSYIPVGMHLSLSGVGDDSRSEMIPRVINLLNAFETAHSELEIVGWEIDKEEDTAHIKIFGI